MNNTNLREIQLVQDKIDVLMECLDTYANTTLGHVEKLKELYGESEKTDAMIFRLLKDLERVEEFLLPSANIRGSIDALETYLNICDKKYDRKFIMVSIMALLMEKKNELDKGEGDYKKIHAKVLENANMDTQEARDIIVSGRFDLMNLLIDGEYGKGYLNGFRYCLCNCEDIDIV
jgi:hypothetical protein